VTRLAPWQIWYADRNPTEGREQSGQRPVLVVSSTFHLRLTGSALVTVLPLTTVERPGWLHRIPLSMRRSTTFVITEQLRTISRDRLSGEPVGRLTTEEIAEVRDVLGQMIDL
jgi:mRNA interferase MazF